MDIKVSYNVANEPLLRQTPGGRGIWKECRFVLNEAARECDIWVVLEGLERRERAFVRRGVTVFIALEPPATEGYLPEFLEQFDLVIAAHTDLPHQNVRNEYQGLPWHIGIDRGTRADQYASGKPRLTIDYDRFVAMQPPEKTGLISTIVSTRNFAPGHKARINFVEVLKRELGDALQVFGRGNQPVADKFDAIAPFHYHLALENSAVPHYWSEKLSDGFLGFAYPLYWGCPNIGDYFAVDSLSAVDITRPAEAVAQIKSILQSGLAEARRPALLAARELVLDRYNTFEVIRRACMSLAPRPSRFATLYPGHHFIPATVKASYALRGLALKVPGAQRLRNALRVTQ
jgi:hypothetical protein